jgi:hypothetical protein
VAVAGD